MALLDICLSEGDSMISQEEARGNIGVITDQNIGYTDSVSNEIPALGGTGESGFSYAS